MTKKKLLLLITFVIPVTYVSLSYADHCPNIKNVVKNGEWHCPTGWYIVEKQGKPNNNISKNTLELAEIRKWGKFSDISKNELVKRFDKPENKNDNTPRIFCYYSHNHYLGLNKGLFRIAKNITVEPINKGKPVILYKIKPTILRASSLWHTWKSIKNIKNANGQINRRVVIYYQCGVFSDPKQCQWNH